MSQSTNKACQSSKKIGGVRSKPQSAMPISCEFHKMHVAIPIAGVSYTQDGSKSWQPRYRGTRAEFLPVNYPVFGQCVKKLLPYASNVIFRLLRHMKKRFLHRKMNEYFDSSYSPVRILCGNAASA
jgi:hypothetical protein